MAKVIRGGERATDRPKKLFVQVYGKEGSGKTSFALSFPQPLWVVNLDRNMDDLLEMLPSNYEIHYEEVPYDVDITRSVAAGVILKVKNLFEEAVKHGTGTFFVDGVDLYWDAVKNAKLPEDAELPNQWGPANSEMSAFYRRAETCPLQVVFSCIASNVWAGATKETARVKADGFKHAGRFINTSVYVFSPEQHTTPDERPVANEGQSHSAYISTSKLNEGIVGRVIPNLSYKMLYRMVFGELPPGHEGLWTPGKKANGAEAGQG